MNQKPSVSFSHIGICTSDIERSVAFYTQALGFELLHAIDDLGPPFDTLMELPGTKLAVRQLRCGDVTIELIGYAVGEVVGSIDRKAMNRLGFTHMTLKVDDVDAIAALITQHGGKVHPETRIDSHFGPILFCTDPDGVRIEVMQP